jgi:hypothetical protein
MNILDGIFKTCDSLIQRGISQEKRIYPDIIHEVKLEGDKLIPVKYDKRLKPSDLEFLSYCLTSYTPIGIIRQAINLGNKDPKWRTLIEEFEARKFEYRTVNFICGNELGLKPVCYIILTSRNRTYSNLLSYIFEQLAIRIYLPAIETKESLAPYFEEEKYKPYIENVLEAFRNWLNKLTSEGVRKMKIDGVRRTVELDGKVKTFLDFSPNERAILENVEFCQGEPLIEDLLELISKVKEEKLYKEFMSRRKDYERNYLAIYLKENHDININISIFIDLKALHVLSIYLNVQDAIVKITSPVAGVLIH